MNNRNGFLLQGNKVISVEVKIGNNTKSKSSKLYMPKDDIDYTLRISRKNLEWKISFVSI